MEPLCRKENSSKIWNVYCAAFKKTNMYFTWARKKNPVFLSDPGVDSATDWGDLLGVGWVPEVAILFRISLKQRIAMARAPERSIFPFLFQMSAPR